MTPSTYKYIILESPADKSRVDIAYAPPWVRRHMCTAQRTDTEDNLLLMLGIN